MLVIWRVLEKPKCEIIHKIRNSPICWELIMSYYSMSKIIKLSLKNMYLTWTLQSFLFDLCFFLPFCTYYYHYHYYFVIFVYDFIAIIIHTFRCSHTFLRIFRTALVIISKMLNPVNVGLWNFQTIAPR